MIRITKTLIRRNKGDTLSPLVQFLFKPCVPCAPPPASLRFSRLFGLTATEPTLSCLRLFSFHPSLPRFPYGVYNSCAFFCASSALLRSPRSRPRSCPRFHPRPRFHLRYFSRFRPRSDPRFQSNSFLILTFCFGHYFIRFL